MGKLPTPIPGKGKILTQLSLWWFDLLKDVCPHHVISADDVPPQWSGRAIRCRRLEMLPVECIARGYLAGLGLAEYREHGSVSGVQLPDGLAEASRLPAPVFTPTTKAAPGAGHDEFITFADVRLKARSAPPWPGRAAAGSHPGDLPAGRRCPWPPSGV